MRLQNRVVFFSTRQLVLDTFTFAHSETLSVKLRALWFQRADDGSRAAKRRNLVGEAERSRHRGRRCPWAARTKPGPPNRCTKPGRAALRRGRRWGGRPGRSRALPNVVRSPGRAARRRGRRWGGRPGRSRALASFGFGIFLPVLLGECPKRMPAADGRRRRARDGSPARPLVHDTVREFGPHPVFGFRSNSCKGWRPEPRTRKQGRLYHERGHAVHRR